jgi:hypothetical protein
VKHRGIEFDVEEELPTKWRWKIYQKIEIGPKIIGEPEYPSRDAAIGACIRKINGDLDRENDAQTP